MKTISRNNNHPIPSDAPACVRQTAQGVEITVQVLPRSSRCEIVGIHDECLKIKLTKPPVDGKANKELCSFIAKQCRTARTKISVVRGETSRRKVVLVEGVLVEDIKSVVEGG